VLVRQHIVALMRPIAFAAAQLNVALRDGAVSPIPAVPRRGSDAGAAGGVAAATQHAERAGGTALDDGDDVVGGQVAA
jgi:hypothetical protein